MLLFEKRFHEGLVNGAITLTFRAWDKPRVKTGGLYRCHPIGVIAVDGISEVPAGRITDAEAKRAGFDSPDELLEYVGTRVEGGVHSGMVLYRVEIHYGGDGDHAPAAFDTKLSDVDLAKITKKLESYDSRSGSGPWTRTTLETIAAHPRVAASQLAKLLGREKLPFKSDVVKLKKLGLTQSFEVGYEVTPRGREFMKRWR